MTFTREDVRKAMAEVVAEMGDGYIYPEEEKELGVCQYANEEGKPSCIVGHVVFKLDEGAFWRLAQAEAEHGTEEAINLTHSGRYLDRDFWDSDAAHFAEVAQQYQDTGVTWGGALAEAEDRA